MSGYLPIETILCPAWMPTLGQGLFDLLTFAIPVVIFVIGGIGNAIYKQKEQEKMRQRSAGGQDKKPDLRDLASQRKAQLHQAARQRGQRSQSSGSSDQSQPRNLTMAERIERARAKAEYNERSEQLDQQHHQSRAHLPPHEQGRHTEDEDEQAARELQLRKREEAQRRKQAERDHAQRERQEQQALERRRQQHGTGQRQADRARYQQDRGTSLSHRHTSSRSSGTSRSGPRQQSTSRSTSRSAQPYAQGQPNPYASDSDSTYNAEPSQSQQGGESLVQETQIGTGAARPFDYSVRRRSSGPMQGRQLRILLSNKDSIRQAIVTKEVLDKPIALREDNQPGDL